MARQIIIDFSSEVAKSDFVHRVRNFGEDLHSALKANGWAAMPLEEVDRATTRLAVTVRAKSQLGVTTSLINKLPERHQLAGSARLSKA